MVTLMPCSYLSAPRPCRMIDKAIEPKVKFTFNFRMLTRVFFRFK